MLNFPLVPGLLLGIYLNLRSSFYVHEIVIPYQIVVFKKFSSHGNYEFYFSLFCFGCFGYSLVFILLIF